MFDKLGIVTNCLAKRLADNDRFEGLIEDFVQNGFMHIEIRDGSYLRGSEFGELLQGLEKAMQHYSDSEWQRLCVAVHDRNSNDVPWLQTQDRRSINRIGRLLQISSELVLSYAIAHPWMDRPENKVEDDADIIRGKKLAYLLSPTKARLRLVHIAVEQALDESTAVSNLHRYQSLTPECPVTLAVENSQLPPYVILNLATQSNAYLAYDEANNYYQDGMTIGDTKIFWERVESRQLISVHLKQKTRDGVRARLGEGFVDLPVLLDRLIDSSYEGDWLLEYRATDQPIHDAIYSREVLLDYQNQKGVNP
jgi:sugar phosphate isomerase/epimerase